MTAVHLGALGLVMEPIGDALERLLQRRAGWRLVLLDPNCRPGAVADRDGYRKRVGVFARRANIVKASVEDLAYLYPNVPLAGGGRGPARGRRRGSSSSPTARTRAARSCPALTCPTVLRRRHGSTVGHGRGHDRRR